MFKNRSFQLKLVDDRKVPTAEPAAPAAEIADVATIVAASTMAIILTYVVSDTFRQVVVLTAMKKIK